MEENKKNLKYYKVWYNTSRKAVKEMEGWSELRCKKFSTNTIVEKDGNRQSGVERTVEGGQGRAWGEGRVDMSQWRKDKMASHMYWVWERVYLYVPCYSCSFAIQTKTTPVFYRPHLVSSGVSRHNLEASPQQKPDWTDIAYRS